MTTATTRRAIKAEIARMRQNEEAQGQWCTCGHSLPTHDVGYTCQSTACKCLVFRPSNADTQPPAPVGTPTPWHRNVSPAWKYPIYADRNGDPNGRDWIHIAMVLSDNPNAEADLDLIVKAVNTYTTNQQRIAELETALRSARGALYAASPETWKPELEQIDAVLNRGGERMGKVVDECTKCGIDHCRYCESKSLFDTNVDAEGYAVTDSSGRWTTICNDCGKDQNDSKRKTRNKRRPVSRSVEPVRQA